MKGKKSTKILWSVLIICALVLPACTAPAQTPAEPPTAEATQAPVEVATEEPAKPAGGADRLVFLSWAGYELPEFWEDFAKNHPDVNVDYSFLTESAEVYSKLQSGFEADIVHPCSNFWKLLVDEDMVQPIDTSKLKNWPGVNKSLAKQGEFNGQQYWIPWDWGFESILVRKDLAKEVPDSWADIWDPQYKGKIAINDSGEAAHIVTSLSLGLDPWNQTDEEYAQVKAKLMELAPSVLAYWSGQTELDQMLAAGDAWLGVGAWNASYISLLKEGKDVEYIVPKEGRTGYLCGFAIPKSSKNVDLALEMIDAYLAPKSMAYLANEYGYGVSNNEALPLIDPEVVKLLSLDDEAVIASTVFYKSITPEQRELWTNTWSEVKTSQ